MEQITLQRINENLEFLRQKVVKIERSVEEINNDLHQVRPEYLKNHKKHKASEQLTLLSSFW